MVSAMAVTLSPSDQVIRAGFGEAGRGGCYLPDFPTPDFRTVLTVCFGHNKKEAAKPPKPA